jgi:hypothetical protein
MIDINKEAEEYGWRIKTNTFSDPVKANDLANSAIQDFIAGHNSKATQAKVLQAKIDVLTEHRNSETIYWLDSSIKLLQQQLEKLENGNKI